MLLQWTQALQWTEINLAFVNNTLNQLRIEWHLDVGLYSKILLRNINNVYALK
jgi:hypothetical protein